MYVLEGVTPCIQNMQLQAGDTGILFVCVAYKIIFDLCVKYFFGTFDHIW